MNRHPAPDRPERPTTELLAPARDLACGRAAIACGADAVYVGADRFGAREAAGNTLDDIAALVAYAHQYWARVYVTINTILTDSELADAERLAWQLHEIGADGLIIQDTGLLECDLPPLPLIASTQMHNHTPAKVAFLEQVGFRRAILARELCLDEIRAIRQAAPAIELECFVHGALCVCYSGQCSLSYALGGRSGNRGQCAQPCRKPYRLLDAGGRRPGRAESPALVARPEPVRASPGTAGRRRHVVQDRGATERPAVRRQRGRALPHAAGCRPGRVRPPPKLVRHIPCRLHARPEQDLQPGLHRPFPPRSHARRSRFRPPRRWWAKTRVA